MNHSFHYFNNAVSFDRLNNNILDKRSGVLVIRLCNLCNFSGVYKPVLEKTMIKKKSLVNYKKWFGFREISGDTAYNYKIRVEINYNKIREYIQSGFEIPQRNFLFKLLRRNFKSQDELIHQIEPSSKSLEKGELITYFSDNIIERDGLFFDIELERVYLSANDIIRNKHNMIAKSSFWFYNSINNLHDFFNNNKNFILLTSNITDYKSIIDKHSLKRVDTARNFSKNELDKCNGYILSINDIDISIDEDIVNYVERKRYEYSFLKNDELSKKIVIPQLLNYSTVVLDDSCLNDTIKPEIIQSFIDTKQVEILTKYYYKYRVSDIKSWYSLIGCNSVISHDFIQKTLKISKINDVKLDISKYKSKVFNLNSFEIEYLNKNKNTANFDIGAFYSLPFNYLKNHYTSFNMLPDEPCGICFEEITAGDIGKSKNCKHVFCYNCLEKALRINGKCPLCRETTCAQHGIIGELKEQLGEKVSFIRDYINKNQDINTIHLVSEYNETVETLNNIFKERKISSITFSQLEKIDSREKTFIFLESLNDENKYIKYFTGGSKCIFLSFRQ